MEYINNGAKQVLNIADNRLYNHMKEKEVEQSEAKKSDEQKLEY